MLPSTNTSIVASLIQRPSPKTDIKDFDLGATHPMQIASAALEKLPAATRSHVTNAAAKYGVDADALAAVVFKESSGNRNAESPSGNHFGLMQLSRPILQKHGVTSWSNPQENLRAGIAHMKEMTQSAAKLLGVPAGEVTMLQAYMLHQQGQFGGGAIIASAAKNETKPAWQAIQEMVNNVRGPRAPQMTEAQAKANLRNNVPAGAKFDVNTGTAAQFLRIWENNLGSDANRPFLAPQSSRLLGA